MRRLRAQDGYLGYIGIMAALIIVAILASTSLKMFSGSGASSTAGGAATDASTMGEVQRAYSAAQRCAAARGAEQCDAAALSEMDPELMRVHDRLSVSGSGANVAVTVTSPSGNSFTIASQNGAQSRTCQKPGNAQCPPNGAW